MEKPKNLPLQNVTNLIHSPMYSHFKPGSNEANTVYEWGVVGAGPGGIAAVGKLIDNGVHPKKIAWIDPDFGVGMLGRKWRSVSSNTTVALFEKFLISSDAFEYNSCAKKFDLHNLNGAYTCKLNYTVEPLEWVTSKLRIKVSAHDDLIKNIFKRNGNWILKSESKSFECQKVILATGSTPKKVESSANVPIMALEDALQINVLNEKCTSEDTVAVFGSSHSAIMIVRDLLSSNVKKVINFYRSPLIFAEYLPDGGIIHDNTGLKGNTAVWAKQNIESGNIPSRLERYISDKDHIDKYLPNCTTVIFAIGFERIEVPVSGMDKLSYNHLTGVIAPGLFGAGIAFPEYRADPAGNDEYRVGLWKFMDYLTRVVPEWVKQ